MKLVNIKQQPIRLTAARKRSVRTQFGTLCYRTTKGNVEVLLVTSRGAGRWILPKGWPMDGTTPAASAQIEAYEEAGALGKVKNTCLGIYSYKKNLKQKDSLPCVVAIFPMKVKRLLNDYPESLERKRKWFSLSKAADKVTEKELARIIRNFDPKRA